MVACLLVVASKLHAADLYVSPNGSDLNDGLSLSSSVLTLSYAVSLAKQKIVGGEKTVNIFVQTGLFRSESISLDDDFAFSSLKIIGAASDQSSFPIFDGVGSSGTWLTLKSKSGIVLDLHVEGLVVRNYKTAISIEGNRDRPMVGVVGVVIRRNFFQNIGSDDESPVSTAAIRLVNSSEGIIELNYFKGIRNKVSCGALHSIYLAHFSSRNQISNNVFDGVCGSVVKLRDRSSGNRILNNVFMRLDEVPAVEEWFCDKAVRKDCTKRMGECPSIENVVRGNLMFFSGSSPMYSVVGGDAPRSWCADKDFLTQRIVSE